MSSVKKVKMENTVFFTGLKHKKEAVMSMVAPHQLRSKLLIKCQLDPLNVVAKLDCWSQL